MAEALFPALSEQLPVADRLSPSPVSTVATSHVAMSESVSVPAKVTVTSVLFQPAAFAAGDGVAVTLGAVLSMLTSDTLAEALLPARSVTVNVVALARAFGGEGKGARSRASSRPDSASLAE